jgi:hypothetical protein
LCIRVFRNRYIRRLWLCQDSYIKKLISKFNINLTIKSLESSLKKTSIYLKNSDKIINQKTHVYQQMIESISYAAVITKLDVAFAASKLSKSLTNSSLDHLQTTHKMLIYLKYTKDYFIVYENQINHSYTIFLASSHAFYVDDSAIRRSAQKYAFKLFNNLIDWKINKQKIVIINTIEIELLTISVIDKKVIW